MAATETRESRRDELLTIAEKLRSYRPPAAADFLAGAATVLLIQLILQIESNGHWYRLVVWTSISTHTIAVTLN